MPQHARPLSPHILIYRHSFTTVLSGLHRITGVALVVGTLLLIALLLALAAGPEPYAKVQAFCASWIGLFMLFGWSWSLCYHLCNGIRHLAWDIGWGFEIPRMNQTGWIVVVISGLMTVLIWACVLVRGGVS
jgi:succinate dehydrogenase / fumarate reductase cytochrome b subunit